MSEQASLDTRPLSELHDEFREGSNNSMPIAGMVCWGALGAAGLFVSENMVGQGALYIMMAVMPLAYILERLRGRNLFSGGDEPLTKLFLQSVGMLAIVIPVFVIAAQQASAPLLIVLGMAIVTGAIWIPFGWAADDPVGMRRAIAQAIGSYAAYALVPETYKASAICLVVVFGYIYVLIFMKKLG